MGRFRSFAMMCTNLLRRVVSYDLRWRIRWWRQIAQTGAVALEARSVYEAAPRSYFDLVADMGAHIYGQDKVAYLLGIPLALDAQVIVELGSAFSYYDLGWEYSDATRDPDEGVSTRVLLAAARLLALRGVDSVVHSIDNRRPGNLQPRLTREFGLERFHQTHFGVDSVAWLGSFEGRIDALFCDSKHTYQLIPN